MVCLRSVQDKVLRPPQIADWKAPQQREDVRERRRGTFSILDLVAPDEAVVPGSIPTPERNN